VLFPYFGGKARVASLVWQYLGNPECYIEPFAGSLAVLFNRPHPPRVEIAVDLDGLLLNFWRSIQKEWPAVRTHLTGAVSEIDIHAKHEALLSQRDVVNDKLRADPDWCNPVLAAWWWEGISSWLGSGWGHRHAKQRPHIDRSLKGVWATRMTDEKIEAVAARLANVVLLAGDWEEAWKRACTDALLKRFDRSGGVSVFLDPPYSGKHTTDVRQEGLYAEDQHLHERITDWALHLDQLERENPKIPHVRVVIAGYAHEYPTLAADGWLLVPWTAPNGYAGKANQRRVQEVLYVRPSRRIKRGTQALPDRSGRASDRAGLPAAGDDDGLGQDGSGDPHRASATKGATRRPRRGVRPQVNEVAVGAGDPQVGSPGQRAGGRR
jgi:site-specific DNA-adenine methylase